MKKQNENTTQYDTDEIGDEFFEELLTLIEEWNTADNHSETYEFERDFYN